MCLDRDVAGVQGKDEQPDQGRVVDRRSTSRLLTSASVRNAPMISVPFWVISGRVFFGERRVVVYQRRLEQFLPDFASGSEMRKTTSWILPSRGWIAKPIWSPFFGFVQVRLTLRRQFLAKPSSFSFDPDAVLRHVGVDPCALGGDEGLAVDGEAIVLVALRRTGLPARRCAKAARSSSPNLASLAKKRVF